MLVLSANPTVDRQVFLDEVTLGTVLRARSAATHPGGKHVDVARAVRAVGGSVELCTLLPADGADWYVRSLAAEGLATRRVEVPGEIRQTVVLFEDAGRVTVINGLGERVMPEDWDRFVECAIAAMVGHTWVVYSGSLAPGVPEDALVQLCERVHAQGGRVAVDSGPAWLRACLPAHPDLVLPNLGEARTALTGVDEPEQVDVGAGVSDEAQALARQLCARGARAAVVTMGAAGLAYHAGGTFGVVGAPRVEVVSPIGAGDALVGGTVARLEAGDPLREALLWGTATASAAVLQLVPGRAGADDVARLHRELRTRADEAVVR